MNKFTLQIVPIESKTSGKFHKMRRMPMDKECPIHYYEEYYDFDDNGKRIEIAKTLVYFQNMKDGRVIDMTPEEYDDNFIIRRFIMRTLVRPILSENSKF